MGRKINGEGSVFKRSDGRWQGSLSLGFDEAGKLIRKHFYGKTRKEVSEKMTTFKEEHNNRSTEIIPEQFTLAVWLNTWLQTFKKNSIKPTTFAQYESISRLYLVPRLGETILSDIKPLQIQTLLNDLYDSGLSRRTIELTKTVLRASLIQAKKLKLLSELPTTDLVLPKKEKPKPKVLDEDVQKILIAELAPNYIGRAIIFALFTGLRRGEVLALKWSDFSAEEKSINVTKSLSRIKTFEGKKSKTILKVSTPKTETSIRTIPLIDKAIELLAEHKKAQEDYKELVGSYYKDSDLIFSNGCGGYIDPGNLNRKLKKVTNKLGLPTISSHAMRHTFATRGLEAGVSLKAMQEFLGHSSIQITGDIYTHLLKKQKVKEMEKINKMF